MLYENTVRPGRKRILAPLTAISLYDTNLHLRICLCVDLSMPVQFFLQPVMMRSPGAENARGLGGALDEVVLEELMEHTK